MEKSEFVRHRVSMAPLMNMVINLWVPRRAGSFLTSLAFLIFSRKALLHGTS
jgi:hypothetical protein